MSQSLEATLDVLLDTRQQRVLQHEAEQTGRQKAIADAHSEFQHKQTKFHTEVHSVIQEVVGRANRHLAKRPEHCELLEVSGCYTGPLYVDGSTCNPIAFELRAGGNKVGDTLMVELAPDGMIEGYLGPSGSSVSPAHAMRNDFGWRPVLLGVFDAGCASELLVRYVAAVTGECSVTTFPV